MNMPAQSQRRGGAGGASARTLLVSSILLAAPLALSAQTAPEAPAPAATAGPTEEIIVLSPFEVVGETRGYQATNTMSGTRFNTKLEDLASSITVMTKNQMSDFAMLDLNDVFLYVAGTEGSGTYTDFTLDRNGSISDNVQNNPTQANRVRGIAPANIALGNIETMARVPVDPITVDAIEVSRGANANVFGLGNPSGTVNQVAASANPNTNRATTELRYDSYGGWRTSLDVNQILIKGKLAIRGSAVLQKDEFDLKPSGVTTERYNGMIKFQPFKYTTVAASIYYYHAYGNRANSLPPRDNLSNWIANGRPTWDPITGQIHAADGSLLTTVTAANYNGPSYFTAGYLGNDRSQLFIDQGGLSYWAAPRGTTSTANPSLATLQFSRYLQPTASNGTTFSGTAPRPLNDPLFSTTPTVSDKSIYDWSSINLSAPNRFWDRTVTTNLSIDQIIIDNAMQTLAVQGAFMREDSERWTRNFIGVSNDNGQSGQLTVDINERLLDGTKNPFFLRPYINVDKPRISSTPAVWDTARAQFAYRIDPTHERTWVKWLGSHQLTGYIERKDRVNRQYSWREGVTSEVSWLPTTVYRGFQSAPALNPSPAAIGATVTPAVPYTINNLSQNAYRYYVGDNVGNNVDYAPGDVQYGTYDYSWGNAATGVFKKESFTLGQVAADKTGGTFNTNTVLKTVGAVVQSHFLDDRLISTFGIREDRVNTKFGSLGTAFTGTYTAPAALAGKAYTGTLQNDYLLDGGMIFDPAVTDAWGNSYSTKGRTTNVQFVLRPFLNTGVVTRLEAGSGASRFFGGLLKGLSVNTNRSNSFLPIPPSQDLYKNLLPNTTGTDKSWGLGLNLMEGKFYLRFTRFDNVQKNAQTTDISTMAGRVLRMDLQTLGAGNPTPYMNLHDTAMHWVQFSNPTWTPGQAATEVERITKFSQTDVSYFSSASPPIAATVDTHSVGSEFELNYNPNRYWTVSGSVTDTQSTNENVSSALSNWIDERMPIWTTLVDSSIKTADAVAEGNPDKLWWKHRYATSGATAANQAATANAPYAATAATPQENFRAFVAVPFAIIKAQEGKASPQIRRYSFRMSTSYQLAGLTENKWLKKVSVGGALRWEDKGAIGYWGMLPDAGGHYTALDPDRPIYDKEHYYVDLFVSYKTKLWRDKLAATFKINVKNLGEGGRLQPVGAFPDGTIHTYRIVAPQQFIFSASFDL